MAIFTDALEAAKKLEASLANTNSNGGEIEGTSPKDEKPKGDTEKVKPKLDGEKPKDSVNKDIDDGGTIEESKDKKEKGDTDMDKEKDSETEKSYNALAVKSLELLSKANETITGLTQKSVDLKSELEKSVAKCDDMQSKLDEEKKAHAELKKSYDELITKSDEAEKSMDEKGKDKADDKDSEKDTDKDENKDTTKKSLDASDDKEEDKSDETSKSKVDDPDKTIDKSLQGKAQTGDADKHDDKDNVEKSTENHEETENEKKEKAFKSFASNVSDTYDYVSKSGLYGPNSDEANRLAALERKIDNVGVLTPQLEEEFNSITF